MSEKRSSFIAQLSDPAAPFPAGDLRLLSDLPEKSAQRLAANWPQIKVERRREIMRGLAELCTHNFEVDFTPIALLALQDPDSLVRAAALETFWDAEDPTLIRPLLHILHTDPEPLVKAGAIRALGNFVLLGELGSLSQHLFDQITAELLAILQDQTHPIIVRNHALEAVAAADLEPIPDLIKAAYRSDDELVRISAIAAMGRTADSTWERFVLAELDNVNPSFRFHAAEAAGQLGLTEAVDQLVELLEDPHPEVIKASIWSLGEIGGAQARQALVRMLDDQEFDVLATEALELLDLVSGSAPIRFYDLDT